MKNKNLSKITAKNSIYSLSSALISKIGGLIFTVIIARLLLPELFGIYSLALSIIIIAITFTDLGISSASTRYISDALGKNKKGKARSYLRYLLKIKFLLILLIILIVVCLSKYLSYGIFQKPLLFFALIFSSVYILIESLRSFLMNLFISIKDLRPVPFLEMFHQLSKILFSFFAVSLLSEQLRVSGLFVAFAISGFLSLAISLMILIKKDKELFFGKNEFIEKPRVLSYVGFMGAASLSLVFFASVDTLMLGRFVEASYIGYYRVALSLVLAISAILSISGILLPTFTQIHKKRLERGFHKTFRYILMFSIPIFFGLVLISNYLILAIYGSEYLLATSTLYAVSLLVIIDPLTNLYSTLFAAKEKAKDISKMILVSLVVNISLTYILIKTLLGFGQEYAIVGVGIATLMSRLFLLFSFSSKTKTSLKISVKYPSYFKFIIAGLVMSAFLLLFNYLVDMNLFYGIIEVIVGMGVYFVTLFLIKGIQKEDFKLLQDIILK